MELKIYFDSRFVRLTDGKCNKKNDTYICNSKADVENALADFKKSSAEYVSLCADSFDDLFAYFKQCFKYIEAAGGFINNDEGECLFIFRREKWDLPKGKLENGETPSIAALREVVEETGLEQVTLNDFRCSTWHTYELKGEQILKQTYWYNMHANKNQSQKPQIEEEITELKWILPKDFEQVLQNTFPSIVTVIKHK